MPRRSAGPRLWLDKKRGAWVVRDGPRFIRTGCGAGNRADAEKWLQAYIGKKHAPTPSNDPLIDEVIAAYGSEHVPHIGRPRNVGYYLGSIIRFWSGLRVSQVTAKRCREYAGSKAGARNDLTYLQAAIRYWHREYGPLSSIPAVIMPKNPEPRDRWLTRSEAAVFLWVSRRNEALKRFILIGLYTGSRSNVILEMRWDWIDLKQGIMRRREHGEAERSNKRRPTTRIGNRLLGFLRRWHKLGREGDLVAPLTKRQLRYAWDKSVARSGCAGITPHSLRHTRATWLMRAGVDPWEAAGHLGMNVQTLLRVYGHHHPDFQRKAAEV